MSVEIGVFWNINSDDKSKLVQVIACCRDQPLPANVNIGKGSKPLSEPILTQTYVANGVTWPLYVERFCKSQIFSPFPACICIIYIQNYTNACFHVLDQTSNVMPAAWLHPVGRYFVIAWFNLFVPSRQSSSLSILAAECLIPRSLHRQTWSCIMAFSGSTMMQSVFHGVSWFSNIVEMDFEFWSNPQIQNCLIFQTDYKWYHASQIQNIQDHTMDIQREKECYCCEMMNTPITKTHTVWGLTNLLKTQAACCL